MLSDGYFIPLFRSYLWGVILVTVIIGCHAGVVYADLAPEYIIELHDEGAEIRVGSATISHKEDYLINDPSDGSDFRGRLFSVHSEFKKSADFSAEQEDITTHLASEDFFSSSFIDVIWKIYSPGQGLKRNLVLEENYVLDQADISVQCRATFLFCIPHVHTRKGQLNRFITHINFADYLSGDSNKESVDQYWVINKPNNMNPGGTAFQHLWQNKEALPIENGLSYDPRTVRKIAGESEKPLKVLWPLAHYFYGDNPLGSEGFYEARRKDFIFPMGWQLDRENVFSTTTMSVTISQVSLRIYERRRNSLKKTDEMYHFHQYLFNAIGYNTMSFVIWGEPEEPIPWGWEYKDLYSFKTIRYLRVIPKKDDEPPVPEAAVTRLTIKEPVGIQEKKGAHGVPMLELAEDVEGENNTTTTIATHQLKLFELLLSPTVYDYHKGHYLESFNSHPMPIELQ